MFEKFTEKAVNVLTVAQDEAVKLSHCEVCPEHLLFGLLAQKTCLSAKLLSFSGVKQDKLSASIKNALKEKEVEKIDKTTIRFSEDLKEIFKLTFDISKKLNNPYIVTEHLFLALLRCNNSKVLSILKEFNIDSEKTIQTVAKFLNKKKVVSPQNYHPENTQKTEIKTPYQEFLLSLKDSSVNPILEKAAAKLSTSKYEILGTEQIIQAILDDSEKSEEFTNILNNFGLNSDNFNRKLDEITNRNEEFGNKQIVFTPNALKVLALAMDTAKESGSVSLNPEHVLLGLLKSKQGVAYKILQSLNINTDDLENQLEKPIEKQMSETLIILRLAKQETRRLGKNILGSEMILLGILGEGIGIGACTLNELGVTLKDVRSEIEKIVGYGDEYNDAQVIFTERAKKIIEKAWEIAHKNNKSKINSEHLLEAITTIPNSVAMTVLQNLGVDVIEIRQGVLKRLEHGQ